MEYKCERCGYATKYKHSLISHLEKNVPCTVTLSDKPRDTLINELRTQKNLKEKTHDCNYCGRRFNNASSRTRHHKICKIKPKDDLEELKKELLHVKTELNTIKTNNSLIGNINIQIHNDNPDAIDVVCSDLQKLWSERKHARNVIKDKLLSVFQNYVNDT